MRSLPAISIQTFSNSGESNAKRWTQLPQTQHISPFTLDRYRWTLRRCGLEIVGVATDKFQRSSLCLSPLWPLVKLYGRVRWGGSRNLAQQNSPVTLFGRTRFIIARSHPTSGDWADDGRDAG